MTYMPRASFIDAIIDLLMLDIESTRYYTISLRHFGHISTIAHLLAKSRYSARCRTRYNSAISADILYRHMLRFSIDCRWPLPFLFINA